MEQEKQLNEQESLQLIQQMILSAKKSVHENGFFYLLWGWLVIVASIADYFFQKMEVANSGWVWIATMSIGGIVSAIYGRKKERMQQVKTHIDVLMQYLWGAFVISLFVILFFSIKAPVSPCPPLLVLCGIGTFVSGGALKFKPLIVGGILFWIFAIVCFLMDAQYHLPLYAFAIFIGYIIPGYLLKANAENPRKRIDA